MKNDINVLSKLEIYGFNKWELLKKKEFEEVKRFFLSSEFIIDIIVGDINGLAHMVILTNQRVIFVSKFLEISSRVEQYGLEQIQDTTLKNIGEVSTLNIFVNNGKIFKIDYLDLKDAQKFGFELSKAYKEFIDSFRRD